MELRKVYVNPDVIKQTEVLLKKYKTEHPESQTPMADAMAELSANEYVDKVRFHRAARKLGWAVTVYRGCCYENGVRVWE